ncbi:hypothetical protein [Thalassotalea sp. PS06]|uniref:hypothetical protein n=1 Tax=Thalassotalea sp. PS06 TaxID=2594005 RepID=UPI0011635F29|nr:hypothetical protein [Thalassotalea sp. PS06]QDP02352.1 hypothetical protein FNC98_13960 [Thalassotalea sp. PS06]
MKTINKTMHWILLGSALSLSITTHAFENSYLCQIEHQTGFIYHIDQKSWQINASDEIRVAYKITVNQTGANLDKYPYQWVNAEDNAFLGFCTDFDLDAQMSCKGLGKLEFHKDTKRFLFVNDKGYVPYNSPRPKYYIADSQSPAPTMEIGTCKQI